MDFNQPFEVSIFVRSYDQLASVYALLGSGVQIAAPAPTFLPNCEPSKDVEIPEAFNTQEEVIGVEEADAGEPVVDAHGWPWDAELHAASKGTLKDGTWRMKHGVARPDPKPGYPLSEGTGTEVSETEPATSTTATETAPVPEDTPTEDDEFAAFTAAAAKVDAPVEIPARTWTDADLGSLCNQAAVKLGNADLVRKIIAEYTPEGEVAHSRNIPADKREEFAAAIEAGAGIKYAG